MPLSFRRATLAGLGVMLALAAPAATQAFAQESKPAAEAPAKPVDPAAVVATVNGQTITEGDLTSAESDLDQQFSRLPAEQRRAAALSAIIEIRLLAGEAQAKGLDKDPEFQRRMKFLQDRALHSQVVEQEVAKAITDDEIRARYDKEIAAAPAVNEVHARHILVKTKEEAEAIIKQLDGGAKFEDIAKEKSSDAGSGANGGDLGYFGPGQMVPEFEKAAFALEPGSYTKEPVQSQFGWHIIKVEDKRAQQPPAFDQVKEQVRSLLLRDKYFALVKSLRGAAKIDVTDPELKKSVDQIDQGK
ncbi:peptidyl-prolyl cis-trans isomerase C [Pseudaminobacter salicylatoxidans]|uniref:Parvulin-like PPIase n=1 Tax=Pseudaminobacter salicylatoxidans TaxID=93369 RepID=A0A316C6S2_PSESE|nr:peptidylprolyl isomerase [Pseudaminobacter salicylatoxidans]PWJ84746.1 peptidyl-prolyl cis-trans isomerase C [Pseudaminobacter salicylatoxidans]